MERVLESVSISEYRYNFILKGGMLLASGKKRATIFTKKEAIYYS